MARPDRALAALLVFVVALVGCSDPAPTWQHVAVDHSPSRNATASNLSGRNPSIEDDWYVWRVPAAAFEPVPGLAGVLRTQRPVLSTGVGRDGQADQLSVAGESWDRFDGGALLAAANPVAHLAALRTELAGKGAFFGAGDMLFLLVDGDSAPADIEYRTHLDRGHRVDDRWRVAVGRFGGEGLSILPTESTTVVVLAEGEQRLQFATVASGGRGANVSFHVHQGTTEIFLHNTQATEPPSMQRHVVDFDAKHGPLRFSVEGAPALTAFLTPTIGPREFGNYVERPWGERRPDLVIFLADTFRADNLAAYGGDGLETPNLDVSFERGLVFEQTWAPSSWTLPSHASLFTGLFPYQHGAVSHTASLGEDAVTIAEHLAAAGYRTGAITDAGYVTREAGLDQGFEWFDQDWGDMDEALDQVEAFIAADDGRPMFLFFQTYRAHTPYAPNPAQRERLSQRLDLSRDFGVVRDAVFGGKGWNPVHDPTVAAPDDMRRFRDLYQSAVAALDLGWKRFEGIAQRNGLFDSGNLIVTSDHGEAFYEHGIIGHGNGVFEEQLRVPLAMFGRGIQPGRNPHVASLLDLAATLSDLAGLSRAPQWLGRDLRSISSDVPAYGWECNHRDEPSSRMRVEDGVKMIVTQNGQTLEGVYELVLDPSESNDRSADADFVGELDTLFGEFEILEKPLVGTGSSVFDPAARDQLKQLGY